MTLATLQVAPIFGPRSMVALYASKRLLEVNNDSMFAFLRHGLRDRLRAVHCPSDIVNAIGGWKTGFFIFLTLLSTYLVVPNLNR